MRRLIKYTGLTAFFGVMVCLGLVLTIGWWGAWILPAVVKPLGVSISAVERDGEGGWQIRDLTYAGDGVAAELRFARLPEPLSFAWAWRQGTLSESRDIEIEGLRVRLSPRDAVVEEPGVGEQTSFLPTDLGAILEDLPAMLRQWLPPVKLTDAIIEQSDPVISTHLREAELRDGRLTLAGTTSYQANSVALDLLLHLREGADWTAQLGFPEYALKLDLQLTPANLLTNGTLDFEGTSLLSFAVDWAEDSWLPQSARIRANTPYELPSEWLQLSELTGQLPDDLLKDTTARVERLRIDYEDEVFQIDLKVGGDSLPEAWGGGGFDVDLLLAGDWESLRAERLQVLTDWLELGLSAPVTYHFATQTFSENSKFNLSADLGKQTLFPVQGRLQGTFLALAESPMDLGQSEVRFEFNGQDLATDFTPHLADRLFLKGSYRPGVLSLAQGRLDIDGYGFLEARGEYHLTEETLALFASGELMPDLLAFYLEGVTLAAPVAFELAAEGAVTQPEISLNAQVEGLDLPQVNLLNLNLEASALGFSGEQFALEASASVAKAALNVALRGSFTEGVVDILVDTLKLDDEEWGTYQLAEAFSLKITPPQQAPQAAWDLSFLQIEPFQLTGPEGFELGGALTATQEIRLDLENFSSGPARAWLRNPPPDIELSSARLSVDPTGPFLDAYLRLRLHAPLEALDEAVGEVDLSMRANRDGLVVERVEATFAGEPLVSGLIRIPVRIAMDVYGVPQVEIIEGALLEGNLDTTINPALMAWLESQFALRLGTGGLGVRLGGAPLAPEVELTMELTNLELPFAGSGETRLLVDRIELRMTADEDQLMLREALLETRGGIIRLGASLPAQGVLSMIQAGTFAEEWETILEELDGAVSLEGFTAVAWNEWLPPIFREQGRIDGRFAVKPGFRWEGALDLVNFAVRPTLYMQSIEGIQASLALDDRTLTLREAGGQIGGSPVNIEGVLDFSDLLNPSYTFTVKGENVPIVRTVDLIVRSDLDLTFASLDEGAAARISGDVGLRSSSLVVNIDPLAPRTAGGPMVRPPFFAVEEAPFNSWEIDLNIQGERFMRVRSPYFAAVLSADMQLSGKLGTPLLLGDIRIDQGMLRFPGASLRLDRGEFFITPEQPDQIQIDLSAIGQRAAYVVTASVTSTVEDPHIQFSSSPSLTNAQILRVLTTGGLESSGAAAIGFYLGQGLLMPAGSSGELADRLTIDIGRNVSATGRDTIDLEFELNERAYLKGEYDEFDAYNLDFVWRLFRR